MPTCTNPQLIATMSKKKIKNCWPQKMKSLSKIQLISETGFLKDPSVRTGI